MKGIKVIAMSKETKRKNILAADKMRTAQHIQQRSELRCVDGLRAHRVCTWRGAGDVVDRVQSSGEGRCAACPAGDLEGLMDGGDASGLTARGYCTDPVASSREGTSTAYVGS